MTTGEAARVLGLSPDMVRWIERVGRLPAQRTTNGVRLFRRDDVERLAAERAGATSTDAREGRRVAATERTTRRPPPKPKARAGGR